MLPVSPRSTFFFFNDTATTEIYTLSLHDALPISLPDLDRPTGVPAAYADHARLMFDLQVLALQGDVTRVISPCSASTCKSKDRKSTRLNSSHQIISYAVFCLKKKKKYQNDKIISS